MIDIYLLDKNRNKIHIIDSYKSLLWIPRYDEIGDCELMINATIENFEKLKNSEYIYRDDDDMTCRIEKIELSTDSENGNYLIITGYDLKKIIAQRIIWQQTNFEGFVEDYIRKLIEDNIINPIIKERKISNFILDKKQGFNEKIEQQVTYDNLNDKIQSLVKSYKWGYKVYIDENKNFVFSLYRGKDKRTLVFFSDNFDNLLTSEYCEDKTNIKNVALTAGQGEGIERIANVIGTNSGLDRYELYVDAREISKTIEYDELLKAYPGGEEIEEEGGIYYCYKGINIAKITKKEDGEIDSVELTDSAYNNALESKGVESLSGYKIKKTFRGTVEPKQSFIYKEDYFLGDVVLVENEYGISSEARITEVMEKYDDEGYGIEPKFEYLEEI